jgi:hypothetical protein
MNTKSVFMTGFLSFVAAAGMFMASNGLAADGHTTRNLKSETTHMDVSALTREARGDMGAAEGVKTGERPSAQLQVMDTKGNVYLLTPLRTKDGKVYSEPLHEYIPRIGN